MNVGLYARVSSYDQNTLPMQVQAIHKYVKSRQWNIVVEIEDIGSGALKRPRREKLLKAARRREVDVIIGVWGLTERKVALSIYLS